MRGQTATIVMSAMKSRKICNVCTMLNGIYPFSYFFLVLSLLANFVRDDIRAPPTARRPT